MVVGVEQREKRQEIRLLCAAGEDDLLGSATVARGDIGAKVGVAVGRNHVAQLAGVGVETRCGEAPDAALGEHDVGVVFVLVEPAFERERFDVHGHSFAADEKSAMVNGWLSSC